MSKTSKQTTEEKTYLGIDYGSTNIGVALGKNSFTTPLKIIDGKNQTGAISTLVRLALENKVAAFVVGVPLTAEGKETAQSIKIRHFAKLLKIMSKKTVIFVNEEGSSQEAFENVLSGGGSPKRRKLADDVAAAIILKRFFQES